MSYWYCRDCDREIGDYNVTFHECCAICGEKVELREDDYTMSKLNTIQTKEKLHDIYAMGKPGPGGAYHHYEINAGGKYEIPIIEFQKGPRHDPESTPGIIDSDLLEIVRHRLQCFQDGEFACHENEEALMHIEEALEWMNKRVESRIARGVLGKSEV